VRSTENQVELAQQAIQLMQLSRIASNADTLVGERQCTLESQLLLFRACCVDESESRARILRRCERLGVQRKISL
jgi:hypothetical protein